MTWRPAPPSSARFETVDWSAHGTGPLPDLGRAGTVYLLGVAGLAAAFCYDLLILPPEEYTISYLVPRTDVFGVVVRAVVWDVDAVDWLFLFSLWSALVFLVRPAAVGDRGRRFRAHLRANPLAAVAVAHLVVAFLAGVVGPTLFDPSVGLDRTTQPPAFVWAPVDATRDCIGPTADGYCRGTLAHPLGTTDVGLDLGILVLSAFRVSIQVALITAAVAMPVAVAVGTVAGYRGGIVDDLLMRSVDVQGALPAFLVYLVIRLQFGQSLFLVVLVFGLFSWGGTARTVRSEVRSIRSELYVAAARGAGASRFTVLTRHVLPNAAASVLAGGARLASGLVLAEAALAFLDLTQPSIASFGDLVANGLEGFPDLWWLSTVPAVALILTVVALNLLADALRDAFDPTGA